MLSSSVGMRAWVSLEGLRRYCSEGPVVGLRSTYVQCAHFQYGICVFSGGREPGSGGMWLASIANSWLPRLSLYYGNVIDTIRHRVQVPDYVLCTATQGLGARLIAADGSSRNERGRDGDER